MTAETAAVPKSFDRTIGQLIDMVEVLAFLAPLDK
jgi:hypothetical protein